MIVYKLYEEELKEIKIADGFFDGWPNPPNKDKHREILSNSYKSIVAIDINKDEIVGFINIISDGILSAYIPLLEVIPAYKNRGIGKGLVKMAIEELKDFYMVDLLCDEDMVSFYEKFGMRKSSGMIIRNYLRQDGE